MSMRLICLIHTLFGCIVDATISESVEHVLLIGLDGFGGEYLSNSTHFLPTINQLISNGSYTYYARNYQPTISAPNWGAILSGLRPIQSGIYSNNWTFAKDIKPNITQQGIFPVSYNYSSNNLSLPLFPTIFDILKQYNPDLTTAVTYNWDWFDNLFVNNTNIDHIYSTNHTFNDTHTVEEMTQFIDKYQPNLMFAYFGSIDESGHDSYWGSHQYYNTTKHIDKLINKMINALKNNNIFNKTQIIITADHGGFRNIHGEFNAANIFIPIIFYGYCIQKNLEISHLYTESIDIATMILNSFHFNVNKLRYLKGKVYDEIYEQHCIITDDNEEKDDKLSYFIAITALSALVLCLSVVILLIVIRNKKKNTRNINKKMSQMTSVKFHKQTDLNDDDNTIVPLTLS